ncbi:MAG: gliding motility-associated C-terminal domain-containing protein [Elusimicrobia bacterium]|nr:gliding motility-associated C-terminal domain-containing protein [Elusimicrobiota bacterium]
MQALVQAWAEGGIRRAVGMLVWAGLLLFACSAARAHTADSAQYILYPAGDDVAGQDGATSAEYELGDAVGEAVANERMFSPSAYQVAFGLRQLMAYPNVTVATATPTPEGATLVWDTPGYDGATGSLMPGTSFFVVVASYTVPNPFVTDNYTVAVATSGQNPGASVTVSLGELVEGTTYFLHIWTADADGNLSFISERSTFTTLTELIAAISDLAAAAGLRRAILTWTHPNPGSKFRHYRVLRSNNATGPFTVVSTTTALGFTDRNLTAYASYFYRIQGEFTTGSFGTPSVTVSTVAHTYKPLEPLGFNVTPAPNQAQLAWSPTARFGDGSPFDNPSAPPADELQGYRVFRATDACVAPTFLASTTAVGYTDNTGGNNYYYRVESYNILGSTGTTQLVDSLGMSYFGTDDCYTRVVMSNKQTEMFLAANNGYGKDIQLVRRRRPQDVNETVLQSAEFRAFVDGATEVKDFRLPAPITIELHYQTAGGSPVPSTGAIPTAFATPLASQQDLGIFWDNGIEFKKLYGKIDTQGQVVRIDAMNFGVYQLRAMFREQGAPTFDSSNLSSRVITPNGDGLNDVLIITFDNPTNSSVRGRIRDISGRVVAEMKPALVANTLTWDGMMNGARVNNGVYLYEIEASGKRYNGTVVAAR